MNEMEEKELPFKLPLKVSNWTGHEEYVDVVDALGELIAYKLPITQADFICLACNSHFEQKKAISMAYEAICTGDQEAEDKAIGLIEDLEEKKECKNCQFWPTGGSQCAVCNYEKGHPNFVSKKMTALKGDTNESD